MGTEQERSINRGVAFGLFVLLKALLFCQNTQKYSLIIFLLFLLGRAEQKFSFNSHLQESSLLNNYKVKSIILE